MFNTGNAARPYRAKVTDFGCAVFLDDSQVDEVPPHGTRFWSSPEQDMSLSVRRELLHRVDVFTLGLVILAVLTSNHSTSAFEYLQSQRVDGPPARNNQMDSGYFKRWGSLTMSSLMMLNCWSNMFVSERSSIKDHAVSQTELLDAETLLPYSLLWTEQWGSIMFQSLEGDIADRNITVRDIVSVLEGINVSVELHGQRDHVRLNNHEIVTPTAMRECLGFVLGEQYHQPWRCKI